MGKTISDIARIANVSKATVSRVINGKSQGVSKETAERIRRIIEQEGYLPNSLARSMVSARTGTLGFVVPDIGNPFFSQIVRGIVRCASRRGYTVFLCNSDNDPELEGAFIQSMLEKRVDGLALISSDKSGKKTIAALKNQDIPVVQVDRIVNPQDASVVIDNRTGMLMAADYFLNKGADKIAFLAGTRGVYTTEQRLMGLKDALENRGRSLTDIWLDYGHYSVASGMEMARRLLDAGTPVRAVLAGCDTIGIGVLRACRARGVRVPEDLEVFGFDGISMAEVVDPVLSTVVQPIDELAEESANLLIGMVEGTVTTKRHLVIEPRLLLRGTTLNG